MKTKIVKKVVLKLFLRFIKKAIKNAIKKAITILIFTRSDKYKMLLEGKKDDKFRYVLFGTPSHGNLGDHAIAVAEETFIKERLGEFIEFSYDDLNLFLNIIFKHTNNKQKFCYTGGGFIGTLWQNEQIMLIRTIKKFATRSIVFFPQTVYFEMSKEGDNALREMKAAVSKCKDITFFLRDKMSFEYMKRNFSATNVKIFLVPDIVTYYPYKSLLLNKREKRILLCLRSDKERVSCHDEIINVCDKYRKYGYEISFTSTVINECGITAEKRKALVDAKINEFASATLVVTDRLHGMLFSTISSVPCIAFDNVSRKVRGQYEWIKKLGYIRFVENDEFSDAIIDEMLRLSKDVYDKSAFEKYYKLMANEIAKIYE